MTRIIDTKSRRRSAKLAAGFVIAAMLALGTVAVPAHAEWNHYYGRPYYYAPVVYGPNIGISLPGINIRIR